MTQQIQGRNLEQEAIDWKKAETVARQAKKRAQEAEAKELHKSVRYIKGLDDDVSDGWRRLEVLDMSGKSWFIAVLPSSIIQDIKLAISKQEGTSLTQQQFMVEKREDELPNSLTVEDSLLVDGSKLYMVKKSTNTRQMDQSWNTECSPKYITYSDSGKQATYSRRMEVCVRAWSVIGQGMEAGIHYFEIKIHTFSDSMWIGLTTDPYQLTDSLRPGILPEEYNDVNHVISREETQQLRGQFPHLPPIASEHTFVLHGKKRGRLDKTINPTDTVGILLDADALRIVYFVNTVQVRAGTLPQGDGCKNSALYPIAGLDCQDDCVEIIGGLEVTAAHLEALPLPES
jgi:hypothetical protein